MIETATFVCSICNEPSLDICVYCTKDTCRNHRCERCKQCSDCCECEVRLVEPARDAAVAATDPAINDVGEAPDPVGQEPTEETMLPAPPEASEEPDLNVPASAAMEHMLEPAPEPKAEEPPAEPGHHE